MRAAERISTAERIPWIDQARGLGILCVVIGHVTSSPDIHRWIFLFHMPFFFALSGYLARPVPLERYVRSRMRALVVPYVAYLALVGALDVCLWAALGTPSVLADSSAKHNLLAIVVGGERLMGPFAVFWFVSCLFFVSIVFDVMLLRLRSALAIGAIAVGCAVVSYLIPHLRVPLGLFSVPLALFFYWLGWSCRGVRAVPLWATLIAIVLLLAMGRISAPFDMKYLQFGLFPVNILAAAAGCAALAGIARVIGLLPPIGILLGILGRASLVVMFLHQVLHFHLIGLMPEWAIVIVAVLVPAMAWWVFGRWGWTSQLLLGTRPARISAAATA